jgi:hypothetical protein
MPTPLATIPIDRPLNFANHRWTVAVGKAQIIPEPREAKE